MFSKHLKSSQYNNPLTPLVGGQGANVGGGAFFAHGQLDNLPDFLH